MSLDPATHYNHDPIGAQLGLAGAGPLALMTGDQLHPPMVDDETTWSDGRRWAEGARQHTRETARLCGLTRGERVLDIGCGVGGPARLLVDQFGVTVLATTISRTQCDTANRLHQGHGTWDEAIRTIVHDCQQPFPEVGFDLAWSQNMLYHVGQHGRLLDNVRAALRPGGRLLIDDWMFTRRATPDDRQQFGHLFISPYIAVREQLVSDVADAGFRIVAMEDLGHVGRTHLALNFRAQFDACFRDPLQSLSDAQTAESFTAAIEATIKWYRDEKLTWFRLVATTDN